MLKKISLIAALVAAVAFLSGSGWASSTGQFTRDLKVTGQVDLDIETGSGDIHVHPGTGDTVHIVGRISVSEGFFSDENADQRVKYIEQNPPIRQNGNNIRIDYVNIRNLSIDYEITVPPETAVRTHSGSGDQTIEGTRGNIDLESGSGDMRLARLTGDLHFQTGSGNIRAREISGPARAKAGSGDIEIDERGAGDIDIRTGSGNITVTGINGGFHAEAGSGDIRGDGVAKSMWSIRTGSGNVNLRLPSDAAFDVDVSSSSGSVTMGHPVTTTIQGRVQESRKSVVGKVRGGGPTVSVHTGSGDIHVD